MPRTSLLVLLLLVGQARAGLHYSGETYAELPSRWGGFLLDQRSLRQIAAKPTRETPASPLRLRYEQEASRLAKLEKRTADESADLGALYIRLGEIGKAVDVLRPAQRANSEHFRLAANLGTAWHLQGELTQAIGALEQAVRLAPGKLTRAEKLHLDLVRLRARERPGTAALDRLFPVEFVGPSGRYEAGKLAPAQQKNLPTAAIALTQQLALWLPADARLLWQLAELANVAGDVTIAAAIMDGCVTEFGLRSPALAEHRKAVRAAANALAKKPAPGKKESHVEHALWFKPRSSRPLLNKIGLAALPPIDPKGLNALAWEVIGETTIDRQARPTFAKYLRELDGKQVALRGYMQPLGDDTDLGAFMFVEYPVGCWFCEMPDMANIVLVEMPEGKSGRFSRDRLRVTGKLVLNSTDPENFLYTVRDAKLSDDGE